MYEERKKSENPEAYYQAKRAYQKKWADKNRDRVREYHKDVLLSLSFANNLHHSANA